MIDRRAILASMAAAPFAGLLPVPALSSEIIKPPRLQFGDTVGLIAPARAVSDGGIANAQQNIRGLGLVPKLGQNVAAKYGYLAGTDQQRADDINAMYADPAVRAVFSISGGWGCARLLPLLDWDIIRANPKLLVGYSDNTALHSAFAAKAGFPTLHAPNAGSSWPDISWHSLWWLAFAGLDPVLGGTQEDFPTERPNRTLHSGKATGRLLGGNLTIISTLMGTPWLPDMDGAILFLEDINEEPYRIDRMLQQLSLAGVLGKINGVVFGQCTRCDAPEEDGQPLGFVLDEVLDQHLAPLGIPAFTGANIGHIRGQLTLPSGAMVEMDADAHTITVKEAIVA